MECRLIDSSHQHQDLCAFNLLALASAAVALGLTAAEFSQQSGNQAHRCGRPRLKIHLDSTDGSDQRMQQRVTLSSLDTPSSYSA